MKVFLLLKTKQRRCVSNFQFQLKIRLVLWSLKKIILNSNLNMGHVPNWVENVCGFVSFLFSATLEVDLGKDIFVFVSTLCEVVGKTGVRDGERH